MYSGTSTRTLFSAVVNICPLISGQRAKLIKCQPQERCAFVDMRPPNHVCMLLTHHSCSCDVCDAATVMLCPQQRRCRVRYLPFLHSLHNKCVSFVGKRISTWTQPKPTGPDGFVGRPDLFRTLHQRNTKLYHKVGKGALISEENKILDFSGLAGRELIIH